MEDVIYAQGGVDTITIMPVQMTVNSYRLLWYYKLSRKFCHKFRGKKMRRTHFRVQRRFNYDSYSTTVQHRYDQLI